MVLRCLDESANFLSNLDQRQEGFSFGSEAYAPGTSKEQTKAVHHVLGSKDFVISFKGPAGREKQH
jgi:hypothetical protein